MSKSMPATVSLPWMEFRYAARKRSPDFIDIADGERSFIIIPRESHRFRFCLRFAEEQVRNRGKPLPWKVVAGIWDAEDPAYRKNTPFRSFHTTYTQVLTGRRRTVKGRSMYFSVKCRDGREVLSARDACQLLGTLFRYRGSNEKTMVCWLGVEEIRLPKDHELVSRLVDDLSHCSYGSRWRTLLGEIIAGIPKFPGVTAKLLPSIAAVFALDDFEDYSGLVSRALKTWDSWQAPEIINGIRRALRDGGPGCAWILQTLLRSPFTRPGTDMPKALQSAVLGVIRRRPSGASVFFALCIVDECGMSGPNVCKVLQSAIKSGKLHPDAEYDAKAVLDKLKHPKRRRTTAKRPRPK